MSTDPTRPERRRQILINGRFIGASATGVQRVAAEIVRALGSAQASAADWVADLEFKVAVPPSLARQAGDFGLPVTVLGPLGGNAWEQVTLPLRGRADVILNLCNMGPLAGRRCVTMIHDAQVFQSPQSYSPVFRRWYAAAHGVIGRRHAATLTVSEFSARELAAFGVCDRAQPVYNGADHILAVQSDPAILQRLDLASRPYVVAPSSTMAHKNIGLLLRVFADPRLAGVTLVLYGSADRAAFLAAGLEPAPGVVFAGRVSDGEMRALLEGAVCLAFPSRTEGFGLPPLEAMYSGCPVVTTGCGALREVCGDAACFAGPDDVTGWTDALIRLCIDADARERLTIAGRHRAQQFTWTAAARRVAAAVRTAAATI